VIKFAVFHYLTFSLSGGTNKTLCPSVNLLHLIYIIFQPLRFLFCLYSLQFRVRNFMCDLWRTKRHWGRFYPSTSVSPVAHSTDCSTLIIAFIRGWYIRPNSGRCAKWTQSHPTPRTPGFSKRIQPSGVSVTVDKLYQLFLSIPNSLLSRHSQVIHVFE
jgi:hypothetical protein